MSGTPGVHVGYMYRPVTQIGCRCRVRFWCQWWCEAWRHPTESCSRGARQRAFPLTGRLLCSRGCWPTSQAEAMVTQKLLERDGVHVRREAFTRACLRGMALVQWNRIGGFGLCSGLGWTGCSWGASVCWAPTCCIRLQWQTRQRCTLALRIESCSLARLGFVESECTLGGGSHCRTEQKFAAGNCYHH